uniref:NAD-dependent epimerase/dehydratase domain-containing protein n=1 Tax=Araucaria cunninghamii TaxID=56994 RepID=A0A0D6QR01_ARACU
MNGKVQPAAVTPTVCVTGAAGFMASWLVKRLLEKGYTVHATARDPDNKAKVSHLLGLPGADERLKLFRAELSEDGSFDAAVAGCDGVFHVATPTEFAPKDPENDLIKPAIEGTLNVLKACTKTKTVKRVVITSSAATVSINTSQEQNQYMDESCWTDVNFLQTEKPPAWSYPVSKTLAEQAAWQFAKEHALDVVTIIPVLIVGPAITPAVPSSVQLALSPLTGNPQFLGGLKGMQLVSGSISLVHVDDVCSAQIFLLENPLAEGRYICCPINSSVPQLAECLAKRYPQYNVSTKIEGVPPTPKVNISSKKLVDSGFNFQYGIDEIYDDAVEYFKKVGLLA